MQINLDDSRMLKFNKLKYDISCQRVKKYLLKKYRMEKYKQNNVSYPQIS